jgi:hypothetical protein
VTQQCFNACDTWGAGSSLRVWTRSDMDAHCPRLLIPPSICSSCTTFEQMLDAASRRQLELVVLDSHARTDLLGLVLNAALISLKRG